MSKLGVVFTLTILLALMLSYATRPEPRPREIPLEAKQIDGAEVKQAELENESCEGDEDCLMRRTLVAHLDYIYTQKHKP